MIYIQAMNVIKKYIKALIAEYKRIGTVCSQMVAPTPPPIILAAELNQRILRHVNSVKTTGISNKDLVSIIYDQLVHGQIDELHAEAILRSIECMRIPKGDKAGLHWLYDTKMAA